MSNETLSEIKNDMQQDADDFKQATRKSLQDLQQQMLSDWMHNSQATLEEHQRTLQTQLGQVQSLSQEIQTSQTQLHNLTTQAQQLSHYQTSLINLSEHLATTTQQLERSHSIRRKVNSGVWSIAMLISATSLILLFLIWQTSRQAEKLANIKAEMAQYGSQATLIETISQQKKLMAKQKEEIQDLTKQIEQAPQTQEQQQAQAERQHQLELERLRLIEQEQQAKQAQQERLAEERAEQARRQAEERAEQARLAQERAEQAKAERQKRCQNNPDNRFNCQ